MLTIHFSADDLARTRMAAGPDSMWEIVNSLHLLQNHDGRLVFHDWRRSVQSRLGDHWLSTAVRRLRILCPFGAYFPDFLTPTLAHCELRDGIDTVLSTPRPQLRRELSQLATTRLLPRWTESVAAGEPAMMRELGATLWAYHHAVLEPVWTEVEGRLRVHRLAKAQVMLDGGPEELLNSFRPMMRWQPPVLEVDYPYQHELALGGRGLLLVPSFFCWGRPVSLADQDLLPVLVYPIEHDPRWRATEAAGQSDRQRLAALIGPTRAELLENVVAGCSAPELARKLGISPSGVSRHAAVLRDAGLIVSHWRGSVLVHLATPLGLALLDQPRSPRTASHQP